MQKSNTVPPKNKVPSTLQKLLEERKVIYTEKKAEAGGIKLSVSLIWNTHNKKYDNKLTEINLKIKDENAKGIKKRIKVHSKR